MSIFRLVVAHCDGEDFNSRCVVSQKMNPDTTQVYRDLTELGWSVVAADGDIFTYCPKHKQK